jgi:hypothetical protein
MTFGSFYFFFQTKIIQRSKYRKEVCPILLSLLVTGNIGGDDKYNRTHKLMMYVDCFTLLTVPLAGAVHLHNLQTNSYFICTVEKITVYCWISLKNPRVNKTQKSLPSIITARPSADLPPPGRLAGNTRTIPITPSSCKLRNRMYSNTNKATRLKLPNINA